RSKHCKLSPFRAVYIYFCQIPSIPLLNIDFGFITGHYFRTNVTQPTRALQNAIDHYAARLEHYALQSPLDWFNFFDFWQLPEIQDKE
ncbi:hypothetical protein GNZ00_25435, partial [Escherichia coli]